MHILIISPIREFIIPLIAFGMMQNLITTDLINPLNDYRYFSYLKQQPKGSVIKFVEKNHIKEGYLLQTIEYEDNSKGIQFQISKDGVKQTIFNNFHRIVPLEKQQKANLKPRFTSKGNQLRFDESFLKPLLNEKNIYSINNMQSVELTIIGNKTQLLYEIHEKHFTTYDEEDEGALGSLESLLRIKDYYYSQNNYTSELFSSSNDNIIISKSNRVILFDGSNSFINHGDKLMENNSITLMSKSDSSLEEALIKFEDEIHYGGNLKKENYNLNVNLLPIGTEVYSALLK